MTSESLTKLGKKDRDEVARCEQIYPSNYTDVVGTYLKKIRKRAAELGGNYPTRDLFSFFYGAASHHCQRGLVDRYWRDSPKLLRRALALSSRFGYLKEILPDVPGLDRIEGYHVHHLIPALASRDGECVKAFVRRFHPPFVGGHRGMDLLSNGIHAVLRQDDKLWKRISPDLATVKESRFVRAMYECLIAIVANDPDSFSTSLANMMKFNRRTDLHLSMDKILCIEAHAFVMLAESRSPTITAKFDRNSAFPWDAEYDRCREGDEAINGEVCYFKLNSVLCSWLMELPDQIEATPLVVSLA